MAKTKIDKVVEVLQQRITEGIYSSGQRLPSERVLGDELGVSRATIRNALTRLQSDNLVDIAPRSGAFVRSLTEKATIGSPSLPIVEGFGVKKTGSFIRAMESQGFSTLIRYIEPSSIVTTGEDICEMLGISPDDEVLRRYRIHLVSRKPYRIIDSYHPASLLGELAGILDDQYIPIFKWLRKNKELMPDQVFEKLNIRMPSLEEAKLLNIGRNQPVVEMDRWVWATDKKDKTHPIEYSRIILNASLHEFTYGYQLDEDASR